MRYFAALVLASLTLPACARAECTFERADKAWLDKSLSNWRVAERTLLKLAPAPLPVIVAVDAKCSYTGRADVAGTVIWTGTAHSGTVVFPDGKTQPLGPLAFASPAVDQATGGYFAISLPSVWRTAGVASVLGLERLMDGVVLHELMHTRQFYFVNPRLAELQRRYALGDEIGDDSLQERFAKNAAYSAAYRAERDALFAAANAPTDVESRRHAARALMLMQARRAQWFRGRDAKWLPLDEIFLTMEGLGQWLAYAWYIQPNSGVPAGTNLLNAVRRDGRYWTQDEGLALFLTVDRLVPNWQRLAFADNPELAEVLLKRATQPL